MDNPGLSGLRADLSGKMLKMARQQILQQEPAMFKVSKKF